MPIYEYRCSSCGTQKEYLQKVSDPVLATCPACGKETFSKMLTAAGFQLKGSGWYVTDFRNNGAKPDASKDQSDKTDKTDKIDKSADKSSDGAADKSGDKSDSKSTASTSDSSGTASASASASPPAP